jgi:hypothetical protein
VTDTRELLRERSHLHLLEWLKYTAMSQMKDRQGSREKREAGLEHVRVASRQISTLLKLAIEGRDEPTFTAVFREWRQELLDDYYDYDAVTSDADLLRAAREDCDRLACGLAMWCQHLLASATTYADRDLLGAMFRTAAAPFATAAAVASVIERALAKDELWTDWFLSELPSNEVHSIPTREELLRTAVLLAAKVDPADPSDPPFPDELLLYRADDLVATSRAFARDPDRWSVVLAPLQLAGENELGGGSSTGVPDLDEPSPTEDFIARLVRLETFVRDAGKVADDQRRAQLRASPLSPTKLAELRASVIGETRRARVIHDVLDAYGATADVDEPAADSSAWRGTSHWLPKRMLVEPTNFVGIDGIGRDLGRAIRREEVRQLVAAMPNEEPEDGGADIQATVQSVVDRMRDDDLDPSLILMPISWELQRRLVRMRIDQGEPLRVPPGRDSDFEGLFDPRVPIMDQPNVPGDRLYVIDLAAAVEMRQWSSDDDSGVRYAVESFTEEQARALLEREPQVRPPDASSDEAIGLLQERVLLKLRLCWHIERANPAAARAVTVPEALRRG